MLDIPPIPPGFDSDSFKPKMKPLDEATGDFIFISDIDGSILIDGPMKINGTLSVNGGIGFYGKKAVLQRKNILNPDESIKSIKESVDEILDTFRYYNLLNSKNND